MNINNDWAHLLGDEIPSGKYIIILLFNQHTRVSLSSSSASSSKSSATSTSVRACGLCCLLMFECVLNACEYVCVCAIITYTRIHWHGSHSRSRSTPQLARRPSSDGHTHLNHYKHNSRSRRTLSIIIIGRTGYFYFLMIRVVGVTEETRTICVLRDPHSTQFTHNSVSPDEDSRSALRSPIELTDSIAL